MSNNNFPLPSAHYYLAYNWDDLGTIAQKQANSEWVKERMRLAKLAEFAHYPTALPSYTIGTLDIISHGETNQLIAFGTEIAKEEEHLTGRQLWVELHQAAALAYSYGKVLADCLTYFYEMDDAVNMHTLIQAKSDALVPEGFFGVQKMDSQEDLESKIIALQAEGYPLPSGVAVVNTMKKIIIDSPERLYQEPDYTWPTHLYETLVTIIDSSRPDFEPLTDKPFPAPQ